MNFGPTRERHSSRSLAYIKCDICNGLGFVHNGKAIDVRKFIKCSKCEGIGQLYIDPEPKPQWKDNKK